MYHNLLTIPHSSLYQHLCVNMFCVCAVYTYNALQVLSRSHLRMKVWERGAGPTLACGTGACATVVAGVLTGRSDRDCTVSLPGGDLQIFWDEKDNKIYMTGPAEVVFKGTI